MFFAGLFAAYFTLRSAATIWPPADVHLAVGRAAISTAVLVASSFTMRRAEHLSRSGDNTGTRIWLGITLVLGAGFLVNQLLDYGGLGFGIASHTFGSMFYIMTGFHGLHVFAGLILIGIVTATAAVAPNRNRAPLRAVAAYWHFVDVVWIGLFATLYLLK
jgi:cytochrome c oxidase subunit 3